MPRPKKPPADKTTVEIEKLDVVKELCAARGISFRDYLNRLIHDDMMHNGEYFNNRYFKNAGPR